MKILCINGHPKAGSFNHALQTAFTTGATEAGHQVESIFVGELEFEMNLKNGYSERVKWENDLEIAWKKIENADHIVWFYPIWWSSMPAILKGFLDRVLIPGKAFKYRENSPMWDELLTGKTSEIVNTLDYPPFYYKWILGNPAASVMKNRILGFVGIKTTRITLIGPIRNSKNEQRLKWLDQLTQQGRSLK